MSGTEGGLLRYQVLLTLFALDILGLGAGNVNICGVGAVFQQVMKRIEVVLLRLGGNRVKRGRRDEWEGEDRKRHGKIKMKRVFCITLHHYLLFIFIYYRVLSI